MTRACRRCPSRISSASAVSAAAPLPAPSGATRRRHRARTDRLRRVAGTNAGREGGRGRSSSACLVSFVFEHGYSSSPRNALTSSNKVSPLIAQRARDLGRLPLAHQPRDAARPRCVDQVGPARELTTASSDAAVVDMPEKRLGVLNQVSFVIVCSGSWLTPAKRGLRLAVVQSRRSPPTAAADPRPSPARSASRAAGSLSPPRRAPHRPRRRSRHASSCGSA